MCGKSGVVVFQWREVVVSQQIYQLVCIFVAVVEGDIMHDINIQACALQGNQAQQIMHDHFPQKGHA